MTKSQQLLIGLSFFLSSLLIGSFPSFLFNTKANSITKTETQRVSVKRNSPPTAPAQLSQKLSDFSLQDENGETRSFRQIKGDKPALIYFFAGGCGHCLKMLPQMQQTEILYKAKSLGYAVMGVEYYGNPTHGKQMIQENDLPSPILADQQAQVCNTFGVGEFTVFLVGKDNVLYFRNIMNGSNWPDDNLLKDVALKISGTNSNANNGQNTPPDTNNSYNVENNLVQTYETTQEVPKDLFANTFLVSNTKGQKIYNLFYLMALTGIFLGTIIALSVNKESWFPIMAVGQLLFLGTYYDVWIQKSLLPLFLLAILCSLLKPQKQSLITAIVFAGTMLLTLTAVKATVGSAFGSLFGFDSNINFTILWQITPAIASSIALAYLSLGMKQTYSKYAYTAAPNFAPTQSVDGAIAIRGVSKAERCDICHQTDMFNFDTSFCSRCNTKTV